MCDTVVALAPVTKVGATLFAKNSDRERNEAQALELHPARNHSESAVARLTYIAIPEVARTRACMIVRPFWMWGAEMGANDAGVAIGNEAVHSVAPASRTEALTGMDLVRLGLERAASAAEAVEVITGLLERHGQGGDCGHLEPFFYHNSFMIADPSEAYVLETVGTWWAAQRVDRVRAISNVLGIGERDRVVSAELQAHAEARGWCDTGGGFDVASRLWDPQQDISTRGVERCARATDLLARIDRIDVPDLMALLRDHGAAATDDPHWSPADVVGRTICMHAGPGDRRSQTVGSMVSELRPDMAVHWLSGSSAPCLSIFKPVLLEVGLPRQGAAPNDRFNDEARWWRHERAHRAALGDYPRRIAAFAPMRDGLERAFRERIDHAIAADVGISRLRLEVDDCWRQADAAVASWASAAEAPIRSGSSYEESWTRLNGVARLDAESA